jgi:hypothetical protein
VRLDPIHRFLPASAIALVLAGVHVSCSDSRGNGEERALNTWDRTIDDQGREFIAEGRQIFRYDTFGDEAFWGATLRLHEALATLTPRAAIESGLKVDAAALPSDVLARIRRQEFDLDSAANTAELLRLDAIVGVRGRFDASGASLATVGITCALCHSTVDDSVAAGIGDRRDGWANRDLDVGAIMALAPDLQHFSTLLQVPEDSVRAVLRSWGPGKFDAQLVLDGKTMRPDGGPAATLIPPAFGLAGVNLHTWTGGWGNMSYWNAFVANLEMGGLGSFYDPRLDDAEKYPVAARARMGHVRDAEDLVTAKLPALGVYQSAIPPPPAPAGSFDPAAAARGQTLFAGKARCAGCHVPPLYTEPGWNLHPAAEIGIDSFQADRSPDGGYRTSPLRGLWSHQKGGFYHDGRFATLADVVDHYDGFQALSLMPAEKLDLVEFLKSI